MSLVAALCFASSSVYLHYRSAADTWVQRNAELGAGDHSAIIQLVIFTKNSTLLIVNG